MMSVFESDIGCAWFVTFMTVYFFTATLSSILSTLVYEKSDGFLLWIFWILSFISTIVFCMAVATSSSKTTRAILIGTLVFFCGVFLTLKIDYKTQQTSTVQIISLHPVAVFSFGLLQLGNLEDIGLGLTFDTIAFSDTASGYTFKNTLTMLCVDIVLWGWLTWYLNRVIKPDYGQALPFYFPFTSTYWCPSKVHAPLSNLAVADKHVNSEIPYEPVSDALQRQADEGMSIEIHDLCKVFGGKPAVDRLNLSMYSGQITALLGHNGTKTSASFGYTVTSIEMHWSNFSRVGCTRRFSQLRVSFLLFV